MRCSDRLSANSCGLYYQPRFIYSFCKTARADVKLISQVKIDGVLHSFLPMLRAAAETYDYCNPTKLLYQLLKKCGQLRLAEEIGRSFFREAVVAAIPYAYASPFGTLRNDEVGAALDSMKVEADRHGIVDRACLYFSDREVEVARACRERGYRVIRVDANAVVEIRDEWHSMDDYFLSTGKSRRKRAKEWTKFSERGFQLHWHRRFDHRLLRIASALETELLLEKDVQTTEGEALAWYESIVRNMPDDYYILEVTDSSNKTVATVLFLVDGGTLIGKVIGMPRNRPELLYFNAAYYEPVRFAIEHGFRAIDYGPSISKAKQLRGASPHWLMGAFQFGDGHTANQYWPQIIDIVDRHYESVWKPERYGRPNL
jgi:predicted N-acyltransferase